MDLTAKEITKAVKGQLIQGSPQNPLRGVSTDSRSIKTGELFIALKGEQFDGHHFLNDTLANGAAGLMVGKDFNLKDFPLAKKDVSLIQVDDTLF